VSEALVNIISNAIKYSLENIEIMIEMYENGNFVNISIIDKGIGISKDDFDKIFKPFFRSADPNAERAGGTGIGLAIVNNIMKAHGGSIDLVSKPGQGSTFTLSFPKGN
jgi:signal transduction histidine kinase